MAAVTASVAALESETPDLDDSIVHIRIQVRNARKFITIVEGLADDLDVKRICKALTRKYNCNGSVVQGGVIQLSGDQRHNVRSFLLTEEICNEEQIIVHGG